MLHNETRFVIPTYGGLEEVLAKEISQLGGRDIEIHWRSVSCTGDQGFMYKANFCLRTGLLVLPLIKSFPVYDEKDLFANLETIEWDKFFSHEQSFKVMCTITSELIEDKSSLSSQVAESIRSYFHDKNEQSPKYVEVDPDFEIHIVIGSKGSILLNSSGESLGTRGYVIEQNSTTLNQIIAAGIVLLSNWEPHQPLIDFMCGSGIIPIEAALWAAKIPPGAFRKKFAFENWINFDLDLFNLIRDKQIARITNNPVRIYANEINNSLYENAMQNIISAGVEDMVTLSNLEFNLLERPNGIGTILINPPMGNKEDVISDREFFSSIGDCFKRKYSNFNAYIFTGNPEVGKLIGLKAKKRIKLFNEEKESRLLGYDLFLGSK